MARRGVIPRLTPALSAPEGGEGVEAPRMYRRAILTVGLAVLPTAFVGPASAQQRTIRVAYAGSMGVVMDKALGPAFARANDAAYQGIGQGSYGLARLLAGKQVQADVFVSVTPGPMQILQQAGLVKRADPVASTQVVIAYSPKSRFAPELKAAAEGKAVWWKVLELKGLRFGRTDPATDPLGQNIIFTMLLADRYYHQPKLSTRILGPLQNPEQIFAEPSLLSRLEGGQIDAAGAYQSQVASHGLPSISLPDQINLSNPAMEARWYSQVQFALPQPDGTEKMVKPQPLVFYAAALTNAVDPGLAERFVAFMLSPEGQKMLRASGYASPRGGPL